MRNWSFTTFQHYIGYSSHYSHTVIVHTWYIEERQTSDTERETWNSTTATLVLLRTRSTALIHGTDVLRPHPMDDDEYDGYIQYKDECGSLLRESNPGLPLERRDV